MRNLKRVLSLALALVMVLGMMVITTSAADYADAEEITYEEAIDVMSGIGLYQGDNAGNVNPTDILTRRDAAVLITRIMLGDKMAGDLAPTKQIFTDVPLTDATKWYAAAVEYCNNIDMIGGYTDTNGDLVFNPKGTLTGTAFAKLLLCALGYDAVAEGYSGPDWEKNINADALAEGLYIDGVNITAPLTREGAAQMILQILDNDALKYTTAYDYATGANVVVGPVVDEKYDDFADKYYPDLVKDTTGGNEEVWGRPYKYEWIYDDEVIYTEWYAPVKTYTTEVSECDIAVDLKLKADATIAKMFLNGEKVNYNDTIEREFAHWNTIGAQGRLTEIYKVGKFYQVVKIDTYLAKVVDVTEIEYDKNAHETIPAEMTVIAYLADGGAELVKTSKKANFEYKFGDMLLINIDAEGNFYVVDYADSLVGSQSAYTYNDDTHEVEDKEYYDAVEFNLDEAEDETNEHTWYFDQYGNLIGVEDIDAVYSYGVISTIYWKDSFDGEDGKAIAKMTYMDGTSETVTVYAVTGDGFDYTTVDVRNQIVDVLTSESLSETKSENADLCNTALFQIESTKMGLVLTEVTDTDDATIETGVPALTDELNAGKTTQFLVYNKITKKYETYTGIKNVPTYKGTPTIWFVDAREDGVADLIFMNDATAADAEQEVIFYANGKLTTKHYLAGTAREYWTIRGGYINGEKATLYLKDEDAVDFINENKNILMTITLTNDYVEDVTDIVVVDDSADQEINFSKTYTIYAGDAAEATLVDDVLVIDGSSYDVEDVKLISDHPYTLKKTLEKAADGDIDAYLYIIFNEAKAGRTMKTALTIYVSEVELGAAAEAAALAAAKAEIKAAGEAYIARESWSAEAKAAGQAALDALLANADELADLANIDFTNTSGTPGINPIRDAVVAYNAEAANTETLTANKTGVATTWDLAGKNLNGNGKVIAATSALANGVVVSTTGGNISNVTISGGKYGVKIDNSTMAADLVLDNVTILNSERAFNITGLAGETPAYKLTVSNSELAGKMSWSETEVTAATFTDCDFRVMGGAKGDMVEFYTGATFTGCDFESGFEFSFADLKALGLVVEIKLVDCTVDGVAIDDMTFNGTEADYTFGA